MSHLPFVLLGSPGRIFWFLLLGLVGWLVRCGVVWCRGLGDQRIGEEGKEVSRELCLFKEGDVC